MKFLKPVLLILTIGTLTYTVHANTTFFNKKGITALEVSNRRNTGTLPVHGDLIFAITAIASLGGYIALKK